MLSDSNTLMMKAMQIFCDVGTIRVPWKVEGAIEILSEALSKIFLLTLIV